MNIVETQADKTWVDYFPYEPRKMQVGMLRIIDSFLKKRTHMVLEASTGIGKTIVNLAAVLPYAKMFDKKIIYTARTHSQMDRVIEELQEISKLQPVTGVALRGRDANCIHPEVKKNAKTNRALQIMCKHLKGAKKCEFNNNIRDEAKLNVVLRELSTQPSTAEFIFDVSSSAELCPAETTRKLLPHVDVVACSYLYIFDPDIRASFLENLEVELEDLIVIIDEAHNLPDMVNQITSDTMSSFSLTRAKREARSKARDDFARFYDAVIDFLHLQDKRMKVYDEEAMDAGIVLEELELMCDIELNEEFFDEMIKVGETIRFNQAKAGKDPRSSVGRIGEFFYRWYDSIGHNDYTYSLEKKRFSDGRDTFTVLNLSALDPSKTILPVLSHVFTSISVTGTLGDPDAYCMLTGINKLDHITNIFPSPYKEENVKSLVVKQVTTTYNKRSPTMWKRMAALINAVSAETPGNVGIFTPSYSILNELIRHGLEDYAPKDLIITKSGMKSKENDKLIEKFKRKANRGGAILCSVLGGRSSEGADFPGDMMNTVIVVGIPYAPPTVKVRAEEAYMNGKFPGMGRMLSYQIPAINRAAQAAGRPVRSLEDRALLVFLDYRFSSNQVREKLPNWIRSSMETIEADTTIIAMKAREFYSLRD